jgi:DNA-binding response OmpR family regulator
MQIAILDDDDAHNDLVASVLSEAGFGCTTFTRPATLLAELRRQTFDLLVLDWTMPGLTGVEVIEKLRSVVSRPLPVLMVTSRSSEGEIVTGLTAGADDYVVKPLSPPVLLARVQALMRRTYPASAAAGGHEDFGAFSFDPATESVSRDGRVEPLTTKEFQLAMVFFRNLSRPLSRDYLLRHVWGRRPDLETRTLDAHVSRLRSKLNLRPANGFRLVTVYGFGYRLEACEAEPSMGTHG